MSPQKQWKMKKVKNSYNKLLETDKAEAIEAQLEDSSPAMKDEAETEERIILH